MIFVQIWRFYDLQYRLLSYSQETIFKMAAVRYVEFQQGNSKHDIPATPCQSTTFSE